MSTDQLITNPETGDEEDAPYDPPFHHYDRNPTEEDLIGESAAQSQLISYLLHVLGWLYRAEGWFVISNLNIYRERQEHEYPLAPDVAVFQGVVVPNPSNRTLRSWRLYEPGRPPPTVVFEIASDTTWKSDLYAKPAAYAVMGVREYYAYEPNDPPYWPKRQRRRLRGWWLHEGRMVEQRPAAQGRLWSPALASWLLPDGAYLRLLTPDGQIRPTEGEAERAAREAERTAKEAAWAKLRELGIDPETLLEP